MSSKSPAGTTVSSAVAVRVRPPPDATTEMVHGPSGVSVPTAMVTCSRSVLRPGANEAVVPGGRHSRWKAKVPEKLAVAATENSNTACPPRAPCWLELTICSLKSADCVTTAHLLARCR